MTGNLGPNACICDTGNLMWNPRCPLHGQPRFRPGWAEAKEAERHGWTVVPPNDDEGDDDELWNMPRDGHDGYGRG